MLLCVGFEPGTFVLEARPATSNALLGAAKFTSDTRWAAEDAGPSKWFTGISQGYSAGAAWGGGPSGPQNAGTVPATGTRRIAILFVDTSSQRYTTDAPTIQGFKDLWLDEPII